MSDLKICRICLRTEARMYNFDNSQLMYYYEEVMAQKVYTTHELPHYFCYECATLLHKFHKFKEKCYRGLNMFKELLYKGPITLERIYKVDRRLSNLTSSLGILTVSKRVKTYTAESSLYDSDDDDNDKSEQDLVDDKKIVENVESETILHNRSSFSDYDDNHDTLDNICIENKPLLSDNEPVSNALCTDLDANAKENKAGSPTTIFIDDKKEIVKLESEPVKESKETAIAIVEPTKRYKFRKPTKVLDANHWKKFVLSEEEALKQFRDRAEDPRFATWPFKCLECFKGFSKEDILKRHRRLRHDESRPLECRFCHMRYKWNSELRKHMRQHFNKYQCLRCNLVCPLETTALLHEDYHNGVVKKCIHCNQEFTHLSTYYTHMRTHRSEYVCIHCGVSFVSLAGLNQHKRLKHFDDEIDSPEDDEEVNTYCEKCDIRFETRKAYDQHHFHSAMHVEGMEDELDDEFSLPKKVLGKKRRSQITKELSKRPTQVEPVHSLKNLRRRRIRKSFKKPMDCHQCGKHFDTQAACLKHHLVEHPRTSFFPPSERHICEICGASLAPGSVANHQNMHSHEKIFSCNICGRGFHASVSLRRHMVTHTGERPYGCTLCDKKFTQSNSMKLHYRTFHLREPYPKRNRRKKDEPKTATEEAEESRTEESEDSQPASRGEMQYLTLQ